ncbi:MAG: hypothetical protein KBD01_20285, partial [Acidobacteria bacterium]|nr:hypothetical protein [Acidobacteriota bacterium]
LAKSRAAGDPLAVAIAAAPSEELAGALTVPVCDTIYGLVKADASAAAIRPGDLLVACALPGHVMRAPEGMPATAIVGKALEPLEAGQALLHVLVTLR